MYCITQYHLLQYSSSSSVVQLTPKTPEANQYQLKMVYYLELDNCALCLMPIWSSNNNTSIQQQQPLHLFEKQQYILCISICGLGCTHNGKMRNFVQPKYKAKKFRQSSILQKLKITDRKSASLQFYECCGTDCHFFLLESLLHIQVFTQQAVNPHFLN